MNEDTNPYETLIDNFLKNESFQDTLSKYGIAEYILDGFNRNNTKNRLLSNLLRNAEIQDRFGFYDGKTNLQYAEKGNIKKNKIWQNEDLLIDDINMYDVICSLEEDREELEHIFSKYNLTKEEELSVIKEDYSSKLKTLKILGKDVSEYPKTLEELTK